MNDGIGVMFYTRMHRNLDEPAVRLFMALMAGFFDIVPENSRLLVVFLVNIMKGIRGVAADTVGRLLRAQPDKFTVDGSVIAFHGMQCLLGNIQLLHQGNILMAFGAKRHDFLGRTRGFSPQPVGNVVVSLRDAPFGMAIETAAQGFFIGHHMVGKPVIKRVEMTILAVRLGLLQNFGIFGLDAVDTIFENVDNFFMGEFFLGKRRLDVADIGTIDRFGYRVMGNFSNIGVAVPAGDISMNTATEHIFINIIIIFLAAFVYSAHVSVLVAHETVFLVGRFRNWI